MTFQGFGYPKMPINTGGRAILGFQGVFVQGGVVSWQEAPQNIVKGGRRLTR